MSEPNKKYHWAYKPKTAPVMKMKQFLPARSSQRKTPKTHRTRLIKPQLPKPRQRSSTSARIPKKARTQITPRPKAPPKAVRAPITQRHAGAGLRLNNTILAGWSKNTTSQRNLNKPKPQQKKD